MITNKYARDYRLENQIDAKGRTVTKAVYVGKYYTFEKTEAEVRAGRTVLLIAGIAAVCMIALGLAVYNNRGFASQYYTLVPFLLCVFPLLYLGMALYSILTFKEKCTREQRDHIADRVAKCGFTGMLFSGIAVIGILVSAILRISGVEERPVTANDIVFISAAVLLFAAFLVVFSRRKTVSMKEIGEETAPEVCN